MDITASEPESVTAFIPIRYFPEVVTNAKYTYLPSNSLKPVKVSLPFAPGKAPLSSSSSLLLLLLSLL
ncbi:MAG: hypothetical protein LBP93_01340, partial [Treponema sp.]|nr:hypothetical protein [Treponema sp.]